MAENETTRDDDGLEAVLAQWVHRLFCVHHDRCDGTLDAYDIEQGREAADVIRARLAAHDHRADNELRERVQALTEEWESAAETIRRQGVAISLEGPAHLCAAAAQRLRALLDDTAAEPVTRTGGA
jgi:hypothetical protein